MISRTAAHERAAVSGVARTPACRIPRFAAGLALGACEEKRDWPSSSCCIPVFFLAVLLAIQFALWSHASHLARAAAEQGASTAAAYGSTPAAGTSCCVPVHRHDGSNSLTTPHVTTTTGTGDTVQVTITGQAQ